MDKIQCGKCGAIISRSRWNAHEGSAKCKKQTQKRSIERTNPTVLLGFTDYVDEKDTFSHHTIDNANAYDALFIAVERRDTRLAQRLLESGVNADAFLLEEGGLLEIIENVDYAMVDVMLPYTRHTTQIIQNAIMIAMRKEIPEMVCFLLHKLH